MMAPRLLLLASLALFLAGCTIPEHPPLLHDLSPAPMSPLDWEKSCGIYVGPIRSTSWHFGTEGVSVAETRLEISGTTGNPLIYIKMETAFTSAGNRSGNRTESFTNIAERRYGTPQGLVASSHAPNQLYIRLLASASSPSYGAFMIVTFHGRNPAHVEFVEHLSRRGDGMLQHLTVLRSALRD